jgi:sRNA-binding regulator protein Hfq
MAFSKRRHFRKKRAGAHAGKPRNFVNPEDPEQTGSESAYFKSLVDSHAQVTVVLKDGERFRGRVRYYDRYCFSLGLSAEGPRIFFRKASVSYICEEQK